MILSSDTIDSIATAIQGVDVLGSDTGAAKNVMLFVNDIQPTPQTVKADLTEATFDGYAKVAVEVAPCYAGFDPLSGLRKVEVRKAAGGVVFITGSDFEGPVTVYGWALLSHDNNTLVGSERFETPIILTSHDQIIDIPTIATEYDEEAFV